MDRNQAARDRLAAAWAAKAKAKAKAEAKAKATPRPAGSLNYTIVCCVELRGIPGITVGKSTAARRGNTLYPVDDVRNPTQLCWISV